MKHAWILAILTASCCIVEARGKHFNHTHNEGHTKR